MTHGPTGNKDVIEDLAQQTAAPVELVKELYEDEVTKLKAGATVDNYIGVIASQRVKRKLQLLRRSVSQDTVHTSSFRTRRLPPDAGARSVIADAAAS
jgi:Protein of unknown function (DUF3562)